MSTYAKVYADWKRCPAKFWGDAAEEIDWVKPATKVFDPHLGEYGRWFVTWLKLEEDMNRPEALTRELLHFERDLNGQLVFTQV